MGSSHFTIPSLTSVAMTVDAIGLEREANWKTVSGSTAKSFPTSRTPYPFKRTVSSPCTIAIATPGTPVRAIPSRTSSSSWGRACSICAAVMSSARAGLCSAQARSNNPSRKLVLDGFMVDSIVWAGPVERISNCSIAREEKLNIAARGLAWRTPIYRSPLAKPSLGAKGGAFRPLRGGSNPSHFRRSAAASWMRAPSGSSGKRLSQRRISFGTVLVSDVEAVAQSPCLSRLCAAGLLKLPGGVRVGRKICASEVRPGADCAPPARRRECLRI